MKLSELKTSGHPLTLLCSFLYFDVSFMIWVMLGALGVYISQDFGLSPFEKGLVVAVPILSGSVFRIILGILTDRIGPKKTAVIGMLVTMIPLLWGTFGGRSLTELYAIGILLGVAGASFAVALPMASRWYPPHLQGLAMGIAGAGNSGTLFATLFGPRLAEQFGWHIVMGIALIPLLIVFILFVSMAKDSPAQPSPQPLKSYLHVFGQKETWFFCLLYSVTFGGFVGLSSFLSIFFVDQYQLSKIHAGDFVTLCVAAGSFFRPVGGLISDRVGGTKVLSVLFVIVALCMAGVSSLPSLSMGYCSIVCRNDGARNGKRRSIPARAAALPQRNRHGDGNRRCGRRNRRVFLAEHLRISQTDDRHICYRFITFSCIALLAFALVLAAGYYWRKSWSAESSPADV
ncbi:MFS transporter [Bacillus subtilis]|uniref:MFS transporter n=1 Tax=Bacillus subtilis TaxID=1423 RepID=UPI0001976236|nr:nitrate/nitrite transporter [Bacillus subtilis]